MFRKKKSDRKDRKEANPTKVNPGKESAKSSRERSIYSGFQRIGAGLTSKGSRLHVAGLSVLLFLATGFFLFFLTGAYTNDKKERFQKQYGLDAYEDDPFRGNLFYDADGYAASAEVAEAGTESDLWGEGCGIFHELKDTDGTIVWSGLEKAIFESMTEEEQEALLRVYEEVEQVLMGGNVPRLDLTEDTALSELLYHGTPRENITSLCEEFNGLIPFSYQGRSYALGFDKKTDGYDNSKYPIGQGYGLDSTGYAIWLFRNALGYTPAALKADSMFAPETVKEVSASELKVGDICLCHDIGMEADNAFGIVAGFEDGAAVVTVIDNRMTDKFPYGCNHFAYIKGIRDAVYGSYPPEHYTRFYRIMELCGEDSYAE